MHDEPTNPSALSPRCAICGSLAVLVDSYGVGLCEPHGVEAIGLDVAAHSVTWSLTPKGEAALAGIESCGHCGAQAGSPAARPTCLWPQHTARIP
jgi:hypothetical protein